MVERGRYQGLAATGQSPSIMVIGCVDSRVSPEVIFDAAPGELLVARNVANIVPRYEPPTTPENDISHQHGTSAALEFAVRILEVPDILVMGHGLCGGVRALLDGAAAEATDFIGSWIEIAAPARARALARTNPQDLQLRCEQETILLSLENLTTFPWIASRLAAGKLRLFGAHFDIRSGELSVLDERGTFGTVPPV